MSKLYYDERHFARFMADEYSVKFNVKFSNCSEFETINYYDFANQSRIKEINKFYIAPESLDIFEPREGDLCKYANIMEEIKYSVVMEGEGLQKKKCFDCFGIIQRNNIPFIMPEVENDR